MSKIVQTKDDSYAETFHGEATAFAGYLGISSLTDFYIANPLARKIVDVIPEEMVTPGFGLDGDVDDKEFKSTWDSMGLNQMIIDAFCWSRLYGGSAVVAMVRDNRVLTSPLKAGAQLEAIRTYEKEMVKIKDRETNPRSSRYGMPKIYTINPGNGVPEYDIHFSRIFVVDGMRIPGAIQIGRAHV